MKAPRSGLATCLTLAACTAVCASDWNEWRGPQRNGVVDNSPPLVDTWPAEGLKQLWVSEDEVPGEDVFGG